MSRVRRCHWELKYLGLREARGFLSSQGVGEVAGGGGRRVAVWMRDTLSDI